jgi:hypothetical protein
MLWMSLALAWALSASAQTTSDVRIVMHRKDPPADTASVCTTYTPNADGLPCSAYVTHGPAPGERLIYFMVVHAPAVGVDGVGFGLKYGGRPGHPNGGIDPDLNIYHLCSDGLGFYSGSDLNLDGTISASEEFPAPESTARITWRTCQDQQIAGDGVNVVIAAVDLYAYSEDLMYLTMQWNVDPPQGPTVAMCNGTEVDLYGSYPPQLWKYFTGQVQLGGDGSKGYACVDLPTRSATWGRLKSLYAPSGRNP